MSTIKPAFMAVAAVAALSAFSTNHVATYHYTLRNGLFELIDNYEPILCEPSPGGQCSYLLKATGTPPQTVYPDDSLYNNILGNPDPNGVDKQLVW